MKTLILFHGTTKEKAEKIKSEGLKTDKPFSANWFMLSSNFNDAVSFAYGDNPTVISFEVPLKENDHWEGYPYLWPANKEKGGHYQGDFYALMKTLPKSFIKDTIGIKTANKIARILYTAQKLINADFQDISSLKKYLETKPFSVYDFMHEFQSYPKSQDLIEESGVDVDEWNKALDEYDHDKIEELSTQIDKSLSKDDKDDFIEYLLIEFSEDAPTWSHMDFESYVLPSNTWLVHFSNNASEIKNSGFKYGMNQIDKLGLTTYFSDKAKSYGGYNFAFIADSKYASHAARNEKYGKDAVMFKAAGVRVFHNADNEEQVIFYGKDVNPSDIVLLRNMGDNWVVAGGKRGYVYSNESFNTAEAWVEKHYSQYQKTTRAANIDYDKKYPKAGNTVSGLNVLSDIPNTSSIKSSFNHYQILNDIRELPFSDFGDPHSVFYATDDFKRSKALSEEIKTSKSIKPLIVAIDNEGPYILEGAHRFVALYYLGLKSFPALVVLDQDQQTKTAHINIKSIADLEKYISSAPKSEIESLRKEIDNVNEEYLSQFDNMPTLFHGTTNKIADEIQKNGFKLTQGKRSGFMGLEKNVQNLAVFLSDNKNLARSFGNNRDPFNGRDTAIVEVKADIHNTLDMTKWNSAIPKEIRDIALESLSKYENKKINKPTQADMFWFIDQPEIVKAIIDNGFDSVKFKESQSTKKELNIKDGDTIAVFNPNKLYIVRPPILTKQDVVDYLNSKKIASKMVSIFDIVDEDTLNDESEEIYDLVDPIEEENYVYQVQSMPAQQAAKTFKTMKGDMLVKEAFDSFATKDQIKLVNDKRKHFNKNRIIVTSNNKIVDGNHHFVASLLENEPILYINLQNPIEKTKTASIKPHKVDTKILEEEAKRYPNAEALLKNGGLSIEALDKAAFGINTNDIIDFDTNDLNIKWHDDERNVQREIKESGLSPKQWAESIDLSEPIEVVFENGKFYIDDGHHRYNAAKILNKKIKGKIIRIYDKPIAKITGNKNYNYDEFHRSFFD